MLPETPKKHSLCNFPMGQALCLCLMWKAANSEALNPSDCIFDCVLSSWETDTRKVWQMLWKCCAHSRGWFPSAGWSKMLLGTKSHLLTPWLVLPLLTTSCTTTWASHNRRSFLKWLPTSRDICMKRPTGEDGDFSTCTIISPPTAWPCSREAWSWWIKVRVDTTEGMPKRWS